MDIKKIATFIALVMQLLQGCKNLLAIKLMVCLFFLTACVGPTTPFGALEKIEKAPAERSFASEQRTLPRYSIEFHPERQVLHDKTDFSVEIKSTQPMSKQLQLQVLHNGYDVTCLGIIYFLTGVSVHFYQTTNPLGFAGSGIKNGVTLLNLTGVDAGKG